MTKKTFDAESFLQKLAQMRRAIPGLQRRELRRIAPTREDIAAVMPAGALDESALETFEIMAVADALESFAHDLQATIAEHEARLMNDCLNVYYAALELARDPANADLLPHVEAMERAYEESYGQPIPPPLKDRQDES